MDQKSAVKVRRWKRADIPAILACQKAAYPHLAQESLQDVRKLEMQLNAFPEGQFLAELNGSVKPLQDRRPDIYEVKSHMPVEVVYVN